MDYGMETHLLVYLNVCVLYTEIKVVPSVTAKH